MSNINILKEQIIHKIVSILKREDVRKEIKHLFFPVIQMILQEIYPYIYLCLIFVCISFFLTLAIFLLLLRKNIFVK